MANEVLDLRRTDERTNVRINPFWMVSAEITKEADDKHAVLFSFPEAKGDYILQNMMLEVTEDYTAGTIAIEIGLGSLATDDVTTDGTLTETDDDEFWASFDPTLGRHFPAAALTEGAPNTIGGTDFVVARDTYGGLVVIGADADVSCIYCKLVSDDVLTAGKARLHVMLSKIQG